MAGVFQVLWGQADGTFKKAAVLNGTDDKPLIIPIEDRKQQTQNICTRPTAVDWDGDGDLDLVVGNFAGTFYLFTGEGDGKFLPKPSPVMAGESPLKIDGAHSDPFVIDWDGDGDLDLLSGSSGGGVYLAENQAGKGKPPELKPFQSLIEPASQTKRGQGYKEEDLVGPTAATRIWVDDMNSDGRLDVLVGDRVTVVSPANGLSEEEVAEKLAAWQEAIDEIRSEMRAPAVDAEKRKELYKRYRELYAERKEIVSEERTGFVWLYLQK